MGNQAEAGADYSAYDSTMKLVERQTAALASYLESFGKCQEENRRLIEALKYYADDKFWKNRDIPTMDRGGRAREILKEVVGYE